MKIATKTNAPIVPVCITNTEAIFEDHLPWIRGGNISIEYGAPIYPEQLGKDEKKHLGTYVQKVIQEMYDRKTSPGGRKSG